MKFKKSKVARRLGGALGLLLALSLVLFPTPALAVPGLPHQFYGTVTVGTELAPEGTVVSARIGGIEYAATTVDASGRYGYTPLFKVPADDPDTPEKEGGVAGETVEFYITNLAMGIDEVRANETAVFEVWGITELDLTVPGVIYYTLTMAVVGEGTVTPESGTYLEGDMAITATAEDGWEFAGWSTADIDEIAEPGLASTTLTLDKDKTVTATFTEVGVTYYTLTMVKVGQGTVAPDSGIYPGGDMAITATPDAGWRFAGWTTDDMAEIAEPSLASTTLTLDKDKTVTATFTEVGVTYYTLTMVKVGQGTVAPDSGIYPAGDRIITATPDPGWRFAGWTTDDIDEIAEPSLASTTLTLDKDKTVTATFTERVGFYATLFADWNLLSTPILLDADSDSLEQILDAASQANIEIYLSWDAQDKLWVPVFGDYELLPLYAIYVKVKADAMAVAEFIPSEELSGLPARDLVPGVNLIGPAPALEGGVFPAMPLDQALISIAEAEGGLTGYVIVVSPEHNQPGWAYALGGVIRDLLPYKGYWVVMENADTLWGFSTTPIP